MTCPLVSVIIRTFNRPAMLKRALESVAAQSYDQVETMIINDGGESVADLVGAFADRLNLQLIEFSPEDKPGRCLAATKGIDASHGEWICYLDDDDVYKSDHIETLMQRAAETGAKVLYTDAEMAKEEPDGQGGYRVVGIEPGPSAEFSRAGFYSGCYIHLSTFCHHRSVYNDFGGFDPELEVLEDMDLFFRYSFDHEFEHIVKVTARYHIRSDFSNAVSQNRDLWVETNNRLCQKYLHFAIPDIMALLTQGQGHVIEFQKLMEGAAQRIAQLEARVAELEKKLGGA